MFIKEGNIYYNINLSTIQCIAEKDGYFVIKINGGDRLLFSFCELKKFLEFLKESKNDEIFEKEEVEEIIKNMK
jgi:hypothetical protein